ncbi:MAG: hypothetical protein FVQ80_16060 [Planctomycetes bacterium]|nr:hypothetical protein [Planctomycetota bacterium]
MQQVYSSIDSLLKATVYEIKSLAKRKKDAVFYTFHLVTVVEGDIYEADTSTDPPIILNTNFIKYVNRFIVDSEDSFYRFHFVTWESFPNLLSDFKRFYGWQRDMVKSWVKKYQKDFIDNFQYRNVFREKVRDQILSNLRYAFKYRFNSPDLRIDEVWVEKDREKRGIVLEIDIDDHIIDSLNKDKKIRERTQKALEQWYRYRGDFRYGKISNPFEDDFPF